MVRVVEFQVTGHMLTGAQVAARLGIEASSWRAMVARGSAPAADDPGDVSVSAFRRTPRWSDASIAAWLPSRRGRGRPRKGVA